MGKIKMRVKLMLLVGITVSSMLLVTISVTAQPAADHRNEWITIDGDNSGRLVEPGPIIGDMLIPDDINRSNRSPLSPPGYYDTSEYMIGDVAVCIIFPESNGTIDSNTETWSSTRRQSCIYEIYYGLKWWERKIPSGNALDFTMYVLTDQTKEQQGYEPINRPYTDQSLWINAIMTNLGYSSGSYFTKVRDFNNNLRTDCGKDWAFTVFVVDSYNDADGKFTDNYFAYAYLGGPFMVMTYDNDGYGINNMDAVTAHETGHIFYALDEYASAGNSATDRSGYLNIENQNNEGDGSSNVACIMRGQVSPYTNNKLCYYSKGQIGWKDSDSDGILDPIDTFPDTTLNPFSPDPTSDTTPTYTGSVTEVPLTNNNPNGYGNDVSINTITNVQYRVDGGNWIIATASDGAFDEYSENYTFTTSGLLDGTHTIEVRATNSVGNTETAYASDTITVDTTVPTVIAVTPTANETNVSITMTVTKTFSEPMDNTATKDAFNLYQDGSWTPVVGAKSWSGNQLIFTPTTSLSWDTKYWANVSTAAKDLAGNPLASAHSVWFRTIPRAVALATGPSGYSNISSITITYTYIGASDNVSIYYTMDEGITWGFIGTDTTVDGSYVWVASLDGTYGWYAVANGGGSIENAPTSGTIPEVYPFILDTAHPIISVAGVSDGEYYNISVTPTIDIVDPNLNTTNITLNDQPFTNGTTITEEGDYILFVQAIDKAGNTASKTISFTIDKTLPSITVTGVVDNFYYNVSVTPMVDVTDLYLNTTKITLNGEPFVSGSTVTDDGNYVLYVEATDKANNLAIKTISFTIDKTAPIIDITGVTNNTYYNVSITPIIEIIEINLDTATVTLNGESFISGTTIIADGNYILFVQAIDKAGNTMSKTVVFTIDKTLPEITVTGIADNTFYNISVTPVIDIIDLNLNTIFITLNGETFTNSNTVTEEGHYVLFVQATDKANNIATKTVSFTIDKTKPYISNVQATPSIQVQNSYVNITCSVIDYFEVNIVNIVITGPIDFTPINVTATKIPNTNNYYYNTTYPIAGNYSYYIWAVDTSGNGNKSVGYYFTITIATTEISDGREFNVIGIGNGTVNIKTVALPQAPPENLQYITCINITITGELTYANITIKYTDSDIAGIDESKLRMYYWNETSKKWESCAKIGTTGVDTINKIVWANVTHFTIFAPMAEASAEVVPATNWLLYIGPLFAFVIIVAVGVTVVLKKKKILQLGKAPIFVECPKCGETIEITSTARPLSIVCPKCGVKGVLEEK